MINLTRRGFLGALLGAGAAVVAAKVLPFGGEQVFKGEVGVIRDFVIVTDKPFNADPTGLTDSTQAFQDAINAAHEIRIPAGTYRVSGIVIDRNVTLKGEGADRTFIRCTSNGDHAAVTVLDDCAIIGINFSGVGMEPGDGMLVHAPTTTEDVCVQGFGCGVRFESS